MRHLVSRVPSLLLLLLLPLYSMLVSNVHRSSSNRSHPREERKKSASLASVPAGVPTTL